MTVMVVVVLMRVLTGLLMIRMRQRHRRRGHQDQTQQGAKRCKTEQGPSSL